ncbi:PQQ-dependent sugar dehydrogenase [Nonomuraea fastidiosa]|uniref:PQQ-dependent sugar dehydrogenase n=1 Tax=Nonomuraea fastidiosa TaxID=46173 RepID=UPI0036718DF2
MRARLIPVLALALLTLGLGAPPAGAQTAEPEAAQGTALGVAKRAERDTAREAEPGAAQNGFDFSRAEVSVTGLQVPWGLAFLPDGSALVSERSTGRIMQVRPGQTPTPVATISGVRASGESGLLGIAVSPAYAQDGWVYAYFTSTAGDNRLVRLKLSAPQTQEVLFSGVPSGTIHDGGRIAFGPDGMLYIATGDAGNTSNAQNLNSPAGKILRMTPEGGVPDGNPFPGSRVWSYGHRNVQGLAWDDEGRMYASEFGQNTWDEVNQIVAGGNYGWPVCEGRCGNSSYRDPIVTWSTAEASPSGLTYADGALYVAALRGQRLWTIPLNAGTPGTPVAELRSSYGRLRAVAAGPDGHLWVATSNRDGRGAPVAQDDRIIRIPPATDGGGEPSGTCTATATTQTQWSTGYVIQPVTVANTGTAPQNGWTVTFTLPDGHAVTGSWNATLTVSGQTVTARNTAHNGTLAAGQSTTFGFQATRPSGDTSVPSGYQCS